MRIISGDVIFNDTSENFQSDLGSIFSKKFLDYSLNNASGERHVYSGNSKNLCYVKCANLHGNSSNEKCIVNANFYNYSTNNSDVASGSFYDLSANLAFSDYGIFKNNSINSGALNVANFCDDSINYFYAVSGEFYNNSTNCGMSDTLSFKDNSKNKSYISKAHFCDNSYNDISGDIEDSIFLGNSVNFGKVKNSIFNCNSVNTGLACLSCFSGNSINSGLAIDSEFLGFSKNKSDNFSGIFSSASVNLGNLDCTNFYRYSVNSGVLKTGNFFDRSINKTQIDCAIFSGDALNCGYVKTGIFYTSGKNLGTVDVFIDGNLLNKPLSGFYSSGYFFDGDKYEYEFDEPFLAKDNNKYYLYSGESITLATGAYDNGLFYSGSLLTCSIPFLTKDDYWVVSGISGFCRAGLYENEFYSNGVFRNGLVVTGEDFKTNITGSGSNYYCISGQNVNALNGLYSIGCFNNGVLDTSVNVDLATPIDSNVFWSYRSGIGSVASGLYYAEEAATIRYTGGIRDNSDQSPQIEKAINANLYFTKYYSPEDQGYAYDPAQDATTLGWFSNGELSIADPTAASDWETYWINNANGAGNSGHFAMASDNFDFYACYSSSVTGSFSGYHNLNPFYSPDPDHPEQIPDFLPYSIWIAESSTSNSGYMMSCSGYYSRAEGYFSTGYFVDGCLIDSVSITGICSGDYPSLSPQVAKNIESKNCYYTYANKQNIILNTPVLTSGFYSNGAFMSGNLVSANYGPLIPIDLSGNNYYYYSGLEVFRYTTYTPLNTGDNTWNIYNNGYKNEASGLYSNGYISGGILTGVTGEIIAKSLDTKIYYKYDTNGNVSAIPDGLTGNIFYVSGLSKGYFLTDLLYQSGIYKVSLDEQIHYLSNGIIVDLQNPILNTGVNLFYTVKSGIADEYTNYIPTLINGTGYIYDNGAERIAYGYYSNGFWGGLDVTGGYSTLGIKTGQYRVGNPYDVIQAKNDNFYYKYNYAANLSFAPAKYHAPTPTTEIIEDGKYHTFVSGTESLASGYYSNGVYESGTKLDYFDFLYRPEIFSASRTLLDLDGTGRYLFTILEDNSYQIRDISAIPYWSNSVSNDWYSLSNWYSNSGLSMNLGYLPSASDDVFILGNSGVVINLDNPQWVQPNSIDARLNTNTSGVAVFAYSTTNKAFSGIIYGNSYFSGVVVRNASTGINGYWSNSVSNDWYSLNNWYSNSGLSTSLNHLPFSFENVAILGNSGVVVDLDNPLWVQPNSIDTRLNTNSTGVPFFAYSTGDKHFNGVIYGDSTFSGVVVE